MSCLTIEEMVSAYIDGELSAAEIQAVEEHLSTCDSCKQVLVELRAVKMALQSLPQVEPPAELHAKIMRNLRPAHENFLDRLGRRVSGWTARQWVPVAAAAMVLLVLVSVSGTMWYASRSTGARTNTALYGKSSDEAMASKAAKPNASMAPLSPAPGAKTAGAQSSTPESANSGLGSGVMADTAGSPGNVRGFATMTVAPDTGRKIIERAQISLQVSRGGVRPAADQAQSIVKSNAGYVESSSIAENKQGQGDFTSFYMVARIPQENLDKALADLSALGKPVRQDTSAQDITDQYVDLDARLRNARNEEQRMLQIMGEARTVGELLQVEGELSRVRGEIESMSAQMQRFDKSVALASVSLDVSEEGAVKPVPSPWSDVWRAFLNAWRSLFLFVAGVAPAVIVVGAVGAAIGLILRRKKAA